MVHHLVGEITVVAHHNHASREVLQIFLQHLQRLDVEVVRGLVEHQEVGALHQNGAQVELAFFTAAQLVDIVVLLLGREHEVLQELRGTQVATTTQIHILGNVAHHVNHLLVFAELQAFLREIAKLHRLSDVELSAIRLLQSQQQFDERRFARSVASHDTHLLESGEVVIKVLQDGHLVLGVRCFKGFRDILALENLRADIHIRGLQANLPFLYALLRHTLQLIESLLTIASLVSTSLRHAAHPLQLRAIEVVRPCHLSPQVVHALLAFLQIIGIVAAIGVDALIVELQNQVAHTVQEETVVGDHQQRLVAPAQPSFQPLNHLQVKMVRRLVKNQEIGFGNQHVGQRHTFLLTATQLPHRLVEVPDFQLRQYLLGSQHALRVALMVETGVEHRLTRVELWRLLQIARLQVAPVDDATLVVALLARQNRQQGRFARSVLGNQPHTLSFSYRERDVLEQHLRAERLRQILYINIRIGHDGNSQLTIYNSQFTII